MLLAGLGLLISETRADEFDTLRQAWRDFTTGGTNLDLSNPVIVSRVSSAASTANTHWNSMVKTNGRTFLWADASSTTISAHITTCYNRLSAMAQGWATVGSSVYSNSALAADIVAGLEWMYANRYNENKTKYNNWWDWEIGTPMALNNCMVMIYPVLSGTQVTNYCAAIDKFTPTVTMTGANRVWKAIAVGARGAVGRNPGKLAAARDGLSDVSGGGAASVFAYVTSGDGFYRDGSFIQHGKHPYTAGYGISLMRELTRMLSWLDGSTWAVTDPLRTNVTRWCYDSYEPMIYYGAMPEHLRGREMSRSSSGFSSGHAAINAMLRLAQTAPAEDAARLKSMAKYWGQVDTTASGLASFVEISLIPVAQQLASDSAIAPRGELIGHYQFPSMDRVMHLRPGFGFGLSMFSSRVYNYESINSENLHGWFTAYGMSYLWNSGDLTQFTDSYWPTVDPYHLPGTTVELTPLPNGANQSKTSGQPWVGGAVVSNLFGTAGMRLADVNGTLRANKSWFMFDDEIVCLGSGITSGGSTNVHTTVENRNLHTSANNQFAVNGVAMPATLGWTSNLQNVAWCYLDSTGGYFFPESANLRAQRLARSGKWSDINTGYSSTTITRNYLSLLWDHGVAPTNASYGYVILPRMTLSQVAQYAANPEVSILTNGPSLQAARENSLGTVAANFWADGVQSIDRLTVDKSAAVMARMTNGLLELSLSDPTWTNTGTIALSYDRPAIRLLSADPGVSVLKLSPVQISVNVNGARGKTFMARFALATNVTAVPDSASTGISTPVPVNVLANDVEIGLPLSISSVGVPAHGSVYAQGSVLLYLPAPGYSGEDMFTYSITDGEHESTGSVTVAVGPSALGLSPAQVSCSSYQAGNGPENTIDRDLATRWSAQGNGQWIQYDLLSTQMVNGVSLAFYLGDTRRAFFDIQLSADGLTWSQVHTNQSSGITTNLQRFDFAGRWTRFVRVVCQGNTQSDWNSVTEFQAHTGMNLSPAAVSDTAVTRRDTPVLISVLDNDFDPDSGPQPFWLVSVSTPGHGSAQSIGGAIRYIPAPGFAGQDTFTYTITDSGLSATGAVAVTTTNWSVPPPVLVNLTLSNSLVNFTAQVSPGPQYHVQISSNLLDWTTVATTNAVASTIFFTDPEPAVYPMRFYRVLGEP